MKPQFLAVDDERLVLGRLIRALEEAVPGCEIHSFTSSREALAALSEHKFCPGVAFLDIEMPAPGGLELAKRIRELSPATKVIFVTGYSQYALDAFAVHARGYIVKPVTADKLKEEIDMLCEPSEQNMARLRVQCFGNFEVFLEGEPMAFSRSKAKELFAYLVHKRGSACTVRELAAILFEDRIYDMSAQNYMQKIISSMMRSFADAALSDVIVKRYNSLAVSTELFDCDFYRFLKLDAAAVNTYMGEYMSQYTWAEFTVGYLDVFLSRA